MAPAVSMPRSFHQFAAGLHDHREPLALVQYLLSELHRLIPSDYSSWKEVVFHGQPKAVGVFSPHNPQATSLLPTFQRHVKEHPVYHYWRRSGNPHTAATWDDVATRTEIDRLPLYEEFYRPLGVRHQLMVALQSKPSHLIYVALNRTKTQFTEEDRDLLTALQPHASHALQSALSFHRLHATIASYSAFVDTLSQSVLCLSPDFQIRWTNQRARADLHTHFGWPANSARLPAELAQRLTQAQAQARTASTPIAVSFHSQAGSLMVRALKKQRDVYLFLQSVAPEPAFDALKTFGLTNREAEILGWVATGKSNEDTAAILGMGASTVKKHLEHIYRILGVANRTEAALKAHGALDRSASL